MGCSEAEQYMEEVGAVRSWVGFLYSLNLSLLICKVGGSNQRVLKSPGLEMPMLKKKKKKKCPCCVR